MELNDEQRRRELKKMWESLSQVPKNVHGPNIFLDENEDKQELKVTITKRTKPMRKCYYSITDNDLYEYVPLNF